MGASWPLLDGGRVGAPVRRRRLLASTLVHKRRSGRIGRGHSQRCSVEGEDGDGLGDARSKGGLGRLLPGAEGEERHGLGGARSKGGRRLSQREGGARSLTRHVHRTQLRDRI
ncbi:hypothetical protein GOP47_0011755 [Adiantum capillus-veneris]|uniref:Uncharacterized protein n=1 Tax=Adiantum capillus-veneris TaxID=13818 RepID=A0A9D4UTT8_ADICA|nr:hypothetical protein GOP47_0011755 [Adiantum capillus-veneris]